jgi:hypothetical protein
MFWLQGVLVLTTITIGSQLFICLKKLDKILVRLDNAIQETSAEVTSTLHHLDVTTDEIKLTSVKMGNLCDAIQFVPIKNQIAKAACFPFRFGRKKKDDKGIHEDSGEYRIVARIAEN